MRSVYVASWLFVIAIGLAVVGEGASGAPESQAFQQHPRLYFTAAELPALRAKRASGVPSQIWKNVVTSAQWCREQTPRSQWTPTLADDPQYENLYNRFYGAMHDMAIVEHLALTSALSGPDKDPYFKAARDWTLACARIWKNEAKNSPDASKAYAVLRVMKSLAVGYDALYPRLNKAERKEIREAILAVGEAYFVFFQDPLTAGKGYNKHHGSVDAAPFGIMALALLGEAPEVEAWLDLAIKKHVEYLLPQALTPSGTSDQSSNFWASTLHYRIFLWTLSAESPVATCSASFPIRCQGESHWPRSSEVSHLSSAITKTIARFCSAHPMDKSTIGRPCSCFLPASSSGRSINTCLNGISRSALYSTLAISLRTSTKNSCLLLGPTLISGTMLR